MKERLVTLTTWTTLFDHQIHLAAKERVKLTIGHGCEVITREGRDVLRLEYTHKEMKAGSELGED